jgi:hypothetical protein
MTMSNKMSNAHPNDEQAESKEWDKAIHDAEEELRATEVQRRRLRQAIAIFKLNKKERVEWPYPRIKAR